MYERRVSQEHCRGHDEVVKVAGVVEAEWFLPRNVQRLEVLGVDYIRPIGVVDVVNVRQYFQIEIWAFWFRGPVWCRCWVGDGVLLTVLFHETMEMLTGLVDVRLRPAVGWNRRVGDHHRREFR